MNFSRTPLLLSRCARRTTICVKTCRKVQTQARYEYSPHDDGDDGGTSFDPIPAGLATPKQLARFLDEYVVGQENAKKVLSVAVFNHYNRVRANFSAMQDAERTWEEFAPEDGQHVSSAKVHPHPYRIPSPLPLHARHTFSIFEKSNVLVLGPTGSGKTLLAKTLAKVLDVPFSVSDATSFTQAGYIGDDVEMCIQRLLQAASWDPQRASVGIVYIDEIDKIARKSGHGGTEVSRDVGGEGVQQALLRMMEGSVITVQAKGAAEAPPIGSEGRTRPGQRNLNVGGPRPDSYSIDTSNVLFILSGAFVGLDNIIKRRVAKGSIGFTANIEKPAEDDATGFMPFFTSNRRNVPNVLDHVEPADLVKYGFIPEFVSRLPSLATLSPLTPQDLRRVLTDVRGSLISQYSALFGYSGVEIRFTSSALDEICFKAAERGGGARGLRGIMENLLLNPMYEVPGSATRHVLVTDAVVRGEQPPLYWIKGQAPAFWAAWAAEEEARPSKLSRSDSCIKYKKSWMYGGTCILCVV
ncbi:P-loop containing nucleoside triphosphate hydrolase protein [Cristinia sonorae]|uniref:P-loop containing nucleoside triphosphate hydrolase protein n=1 Tax=Cristinia sonorae TaxID=1940300 RepID=A0A8K0XN50_9AGAR|nr:P-loop containing nucleoside triphosphate hydrolase protein [Cristinia sonorae]